MFDKLIDILVSSIKLFIPFHVVDEFQGALVLRFGKFHREIPPGFHWIYPFGIEQVLSCDICLCTVDLKPQSLTTRDEENIVLTATVSYRVEDPKVYLLKVMNAAAVIEDSSTGIIHEFVSKSTWNQLSTGDLAYELEKAIRRKAKNFGIAVDSVYLKDFQKCRAYRIIGVN